MKTRNVWKVMGKRTSVGENHQSEIINLINNDRIINKSKVNVDNTNRTNKHPGKKAKRYANKKINVKPNLKVFYTNADQFPNKNDDLRMFIADKDPDILLIPEIIPKQQ